MRIAFTGHRPESLPFRLDSYECHQMEMALQHIIQEKIKEGCDTFYCGAARGIDIICGEIVLSEKAAGYPHIQLICAIPFKEQANRWEPDWQIRYNSLLRNTDRIVQLCDHYQRDCYFIRNRYMVDNSDILIAVYDGSGKGGTAYTVNWAKKQGKPIILVNPQTFII